MDEDKSFEMPEETTIQIVEKIRAMASRIGGDWSDPRRECGEILRLCDILKTKLD